MIVTYSRIEPDELYHVSRSGLGGGFSRALVLFNFPTALMAIAVLAFAVLMFVLCFTPVPVERIGG